MLSHLRYALGTPVRARARRTRAAFLTALKDCRGEQARVLTRLLALHRDSDFSRDYGLSGCRTAAEFQRALPVADFERARPYVERLRNGDWRALMGSRERPLMFAMSSGTTSEPKCIPITRQYLADYRRGWTSWGIDLYERFPKMNWLHIVQLASDFDRGRTPVGTPCGNITGFVQHIQNPIIRTMYSVPNPVLKIRDAASKYYTALRFALADPAVGMVMTANPSTLTHLAEFAAEHQDSLLKDIADGTLSAAWEIPAEVRRRLRWSLRPRPARARVLADSARATGNLTLHGAWPDLQLLAVWTAGSAGAYLGRLRGLFPGVTVRDHGLSASEGRMTITLEDECRDAPLDVTSHFFEFIPEQEIDSPRPTVLLAHELEAGRNYFILLTTSCGLYRYDIRDVVRCTGFEGTTPRLEFLHKGAHIANVTGEKLTESQVVEAVTGAAKSFDVALRYFTLTPVWGSPPRYHFLVEEGDVPPALALRMIGSIDERLMRLNCEYDDKRQTSRLGAIALTWLPPGTWARLIRSKQSRPSGSLEQYKHPCLAPDLLFQERLLAEHGLRRAASA